MLSPSPCSQLLQPTTQWNELWRRLRGLPNCLRQTEQSHLCFTTPLPLYTNSRVTHNSRQQLQHGSVPRSSCITNQKRHLLAQTCFLCVSEVLGDYAEIKILAVQQLQRAVLLLLSSEPQQQQHFVFSSAALLGVHTFPFKPHSPKTEHSSQVLCALRLFRGMTIPLTEQLQMFHGSSSACKIMLQKMSSPGTCQSHRPLTRWATQKHWPHRRDNPHC